MSRPAAWTFRPRRHLSAVEKRRRAERGGIDDSSDLDEFVGLADRVLVMHQGRQSGELAQQAVSVDRMTPALEDRHENVIKES